MDSIALWYEDDDVVTRIQRRAVRDRSNILSLGDKSFEKNFRLNKEAFLYVLRNIEGDLRVARKSTAAPPILKLSAALTFLAQGGYQHQIGQDFHVGLAQQTMSTCLWEVCSAIEKNLCRKHITFKMSQDEEKEAKMCFYSKSGIPGIIGAIDGTHIQIIRPAMNEHLFFNRKLKHSMNAMLICDHKMTIRAIDARFGGACHDSHVWNLSSERRKLKERYESGDKRSWIIGDSGYPLEPWILTSYRNAAEGSNEAYFNENFSKARVVIERVFGVLKGRFRCLLAARELHYAPHKAVKIFNVCCALHNICLLYNVPRNFEIPVDEEVPSLFYDDLQSRKNLRNIAANIRDEIKNSMIR